MLTSTESAKFFDACRRRLRDALEEETEALLERPPAQKAEGTHRSAFVFPAAFGRTPG